MRKSKLLIASLIIGIVVSWLSLFSTDLVFAASYDKSIYEVDNIQDGITISGVTKSEKSGIKKAIKEKDATGAGDAFFSSIIREYLESNCTFDPTKFSLWYKNSLKLTSKVVTSFGARTHLINLYKVKSKENICTCSDFEITN